MVEEAFDPDATVFARNLTSLLQLPDADGVRGLVIGRFQAASQVTQSLIDQIIARQDLPDGFPVLANADFGHTDPRITFPIGGRVEMSVGATSSLKITDT